MLYLKLVPVEFKNASHDKRELSVAEALGYKTLVVATTKKEKNYQEFYDGYDVYYISTRRLGKAAWATPLNRGIALIDFFIKVVQTDAAIVSGHDYIVTLVAYIANCFKRRKAKIIYDSHEFELYQDPSRGRLVLWGIRCIEGCLLRRVDCTLIVGDKMADGVQEIYKLETRPTVVRNIPAYWHLDQERSGKNRKQFLTALGLPEDGFLLMYHGGIAPGRGIEYAIKALTFLPEDIGLVIMGYENMPNTIEQLKALIEEKGVSHRVCFYPAVSVIELKDYIGAVDVELVLQSAWCINFLYSLPNKFFESIQSCVPIICCDLPEMGKLVRQYDIGLLVNENDEKSVAEAVLKLRKDKALYHALKRNMEKAKKELCWERESLKLEKAIQEMMKAT